MNGLLHAIVVSYRVMREIAEADTTPAAPISNVRRLRCMMGP